MAIATFIKIAGSGRNCMIAVKKNPLSSKGQICFAPTEGVEHFAGKPADTLEKAHKFEIPDGFTFEECFNEEGVQLLYPDGAAVMQLVY